MRISDWSSDVCSSDLDELGDLLLQVVFHARMAQERGAFAFADVVAAISDKMLRRHPHVFAPRGRANAAEGRMPGTAAGASVENVGSEERRVGNECVITCRSGWSPYH